ncbi:hypothetical protein ACHAXR_002015, partial [Thalassiosira sp. AJA248-18]
LTLTDVIGELERRGLQPKGFYSDDAKRLQRCFDDEHGEYVETKRKEMRDAMIAEAEQRREQHKKDLIESLILEEKEHISNNSRLSEWFKSKYTHFDCQINDITARSLARLLWSDTRIISVDLSNMNLSDKAGAYLTRALSNNNTLMKLELDGNSFGQETVKSLATSLSVNNTLTFLSIGSNPLANGQGEANQHCIEELALAISNNSTLTCLSIWRCGIGLGGGKILCNAVSKNTNLISVEVGYNDFLNSDIMFMTKQLDENRRARELRLSQDAELTKEKERALLEQQKVEQDRLKEERDRHWLEEQKVSRAESRRLEVEREQDEHQREEEKKLQMEHIQKLEEERVKAASKKGKKGKKGKNGGKKKGKKK